MSDHWERFPCSIDGHAAYISYDHGVRSEIENLPLPFFASFLVDLVQPDERGLPRDEEFPKLNAIEDFLKASIAGGLGLQVGRISCHGRRYFHFYTRLDEATCTALARDAGERHGYNIGLLHKEDSKRSHYWNELFPTADDWQVIQDIHMQEALLRQGDSLSEPREIEHSAYFKAPGQRDAFVTGISAHFKEIEYFETPDAPHGRYAVTLKHIALPDYRSIGKFTLMLRRAARENQGEYDGWETRACTAPARYATMATP